MRPRLLLRIAAIIMFLHAAGHTVGIYTWKRTSGHVPQEVVKPMVEQTFSFNGVVATMAQFYDGLGYASTLALMLVASILWIISSLDEKNAGLAARILVVVALFLFGLGIDEVIYFFPTAAAFSFVSAILAGIAIWMLRNRNVS